MPLLERARVLRSNQTQAEQRLWYYLRARRFFRAEIQAIKAGRELHRRFRLFLPKIDY
jgi:very-short-patch-repair endonuclease